MTKENETIEAISDHMADNFDKGKSKKRLSILPWVVYALVIATAGLAVVSWCKNTAEIADEWYYLALFSCVAAFLLAVFPIKLPKALTALLMIVIPIGSFYLLEWMTHDPEMIVMSVQVLEYIFYGLLFMLVFAICGRADVGYFLATAFVLVIGLANYFVLDFRGNPILPWDLNAAGTALSVADNFVFQGTFEVMWCLLGFLGLFAVIPKLDLKIRTAKVRIFWIALLCILSFAYFRALQVKEIKDKAKVYEEPFTQWHVYKKNGFFVSFIVNARFMDFTVPEGYSPDAAQAVLREAKEAYGKEQTPGGKQGGEAGNQEQPPKGMQGGESENQERPNIIVIMDEAFSDLTVLGDFETNKAVMPNINKLFKGDDVISGTLRVSVFGGNTANTEFEFLTGMSCAFLPSGSTAYQQYIKHDTPSMASILKSYGYETLAMHPYGATGWNRNEVYPWLGFDRSMFKPDFAERAVLRNYVSDKAVVRQIIREYEAKEEGKPLFAFAVTMQNHGSYSKSFENFTPDIYVTNPDLGKLPKTEMYLTLCRWTDDAVRKLVSYFKETDEKTLIVFFGDHQPALLETKFFKSLLGKNPADLTWEEQVPRYQVPFFIWANYDLGELEQSDVDISANYLSNLVMDAAGLPKTDFQIYLETLREELPVVTAGFYFTKDGELHEVTEDAIAAEPLLKQYRIVQYNDLFDWKKRVDGFSATK